VKGKYIKTGKVCNDKVYVFPTEHHYEKTGELPYIKYGCPVCEEIGARFSIPFGSSNCPVCGVNLFWGYEIDCNG